MTNKETYSEAGNDEAAISSLNSKVRAIKSSPSVESGTESSNDSAISTTGSNLSSSELNSSSSSSPALADNNGDPSPSHSLDMDTTNESREQIHDDSTSSEPKSSKANDLATTLTNNQASLATRRAFKPSVKWPGDNHRVGVQHRVDREQLYETDNIRYYQDLYHNPQAQPMNYNPQHIVTLPAYTSTIAATTTTGTLYVPPVHEICHQQQPYAANLQHGGYCSLIPAQTYALPTQPLQLSSQTSNQPSIYTAAPIKSHQSNFYPHYLTHAGPHQHHLGFYDQSMAAMQHQQHIVRPSNHYHPAYGHIPMTTPIYYTNGPHLFHHPNYQQTVQYNLGSTTTDVSDNSTWVNRNHDGDPHQSKADCFQANRRGSHLVKAAAVVADSKPQIATDDDDDSDSHDSVSGTNDSSCGSNSGVGGDATVCLTNGANQCDNHCNRFPPSYQDDGYCVRQQQPTSKPNKSGNNAEDADSISESHDIDTDTASAKQSVDSTSTSIDTSLDPSSSASLLSQTRQQSKQTPSTNNNPTCSSYNQSAPLVSSITTTSTTTTTSVRLPDEISGSNLMVPQIKGNNVSLNDDEKVKKNCEPYVDGVSSNKNNNIANTTRLTSNQYKQTCLDVNQTSSTNSTSSSGGQEDVDAGGQVSSKAIKAEKGAETTQDSTGENLNADANAESIGELKDNINCIDSISRRPSRANCYQSLRHNQHHQSTTNTSAQPQHLQATTTLSINRHQQQQNHAHFASPVGIDNNSNNQNVPQQQLASQNHHLVYAPSTQAMLLLPGAQHQAIPQQPALNLLTQAQYYCPTSGQALYEHHNPYTAEMAQNSSHKFNIGLPPISSAPVANYHQPGGQPFVYSAAQHQPHPSMFPYYYRSHPHSYPELATASIHNQPMMYNGHIIMFDPMTAQHQQQFVQPQMNSSVNSASCQPHVGAFFHHQAPLSKTAMGRFCVASASQDLNLSYLPIDSQPTQTRQAYGMDKVWQDEFDQLFSQFPLQITWTLIEVETNPVIRESNNIVGYKGHYLISIPSGDHQESPSESSNSPQLDTRCGKTDEGVLERSQSGDESTTGENLSSTSSGVCSRDDNSADIVDGNEDKEKDAGSSSTPSSIQGEDDSDCDSGALIGSTTSGGSDDTCNVESSPVQETEAPTAPSDIEEKNLTTSSSTQVSTNPQKCSVNQHQEQRRMPTKFRMFIDSAKVRFCCDSCGHGWTSMKGRVVFWYELFEIVDENATTTSAAHGDYSLHSGAQLIGYCAYKLFGQQCDVCKIENRFERPMWYPEEVTKALGNLYNKIGQVYFGFKMPAIDKQRRAGKPKTSHNSSLCQACHDGVCTDRK